MWQEKTDKKNRLDIKNMTMVGVFVVLIAVGAFIKFPIWFIPFSLQFIFTNLAGLILGKKYGALAVIIYAIVGLLGVPIFTAGGGIGYVFQPSFGYIIGMAVGAFVVGHYTENRRDLKSMIIGSLLNMTVIYAIGLPYLVLIINVYLSKAVALKTLVVSGFLITLPGDIVKCYISAIFTKKIDKHIRASIGFN